MFATNNNAKIVLCTIMVSVLLMLNENAIARSISLDKDSTNIYFKNFNDNIRIKGKIVTSSNVAIKDVDVSVFGPEYRNDKKVDVNGAFLFNDLIENNNYEIHISKHGNPMEGISVMDMVYLNKHISGNVPFKTAYQKLAADVDFSNDLTEHDMLEFKQYILGIKSSDQLTKPWYFIDTNQEIVFQSNGTDEPIAKEYNDLTENKNSSNFIGVKTGDVNGSINEIYSSNADNNIYDVIEISIPNTLFEENEIIEIPVYSHKDFEISGLQLGMEYDEDVFEVLEIISGSIELGQNDYVFGDNNFRMAYAPLNTVEVSSEEPLFTFRVRTKKTGKASEQFAVSNTITESIAYDENENLLYIQNQLQIEEVLTVLQNSPNPFIETTNLKFSLTESMPVEITIYDAQGNRIYNKYESYQKGVHVMAIGDIELSNSSGIFVVNVESAEISTSKKILRIK